MGDQSNDLPSSVTSEGKITNRIPEIPTSFKHFNESVIMILFVSQSLVGFSPFVLAKVNSQQTLLGQKVVQMFIEGYCTK
jgi:hypothetical protein